MRWLAWLYLSRDGRIGRRTWWGAGLALLVVNQLLLVLLLWAAGVSPSTYFASLTLQNRVNSAFAPVFRVEGVVGLVVFLMLVVPWLSLGIKRRHDRGRSGIDYLVFTGLGFVLALVNVVGLAPSGAELITSVTAYGVLSWIILAFSLYLLVVLGLLGTVAGPGGVMAAGEATAAVPAGGRWPDSAGAEAGANVGSSPFVAETRNPLLRYWRGLFPLGRSFWAINFIVGLVIEGGVLVLVPVFEGDGTIDPLLQFVVLLVGAALLTIVLGWLRVGVWRSARRRAAQRRSQGRRAFWARIAQAGTVPPILYDVVLVYFCLMMAAEYFPIAFQGDPAMPAYTLTVLPGGEALDVSGGVKFGLARDIEAALRVSPTIRTLYLTSPGGRLGAAEQVADLIVRRGLDTYVPTECDSACTRIFVAGKTRTLREGAQLGFHSSRSTGGNIPAAVTAKANTMIASRYVAAGIDPGFMARAEAVSPTTIWYPTDAELVAAHVVTQISDGHAFGSSAADLKAAADRQRVAAAAGKGGALPTGVVTEPMPAGLAGSGR